MGNETGACSDGSIVAELRSRVASMAERNSTQEPVAPPSVGAGGVSARASPPVGEAALAIADEMLGLREARHRCTRAEEDDGDAHSDGARLLVGGQEFEVPAHGVVLGRQPGAAGIVVDDKRVSRRHVWIQPTGAGVFVADLGSMNGTMVVRNDMRTSAAEEQVPAAHGDRITTADGVLLAEVVGQSRGDWS